MPAKIAIARTEWSHSELNRRIEMLTGILRKTHVGAMPVVLDATAMADAVRLTPERFDLLVLPDTHSVPLSIGQNVLNYIESGGSILTFGGVLFDSVLIKSDSGWIPVKEALQAAKPEFVIGDFKEDMALSAWERASHKPESLGEIRRVDGPPGTTGAMELKTTFGPEKIWETRKLVKLPASIPAGHHLTTFWVKGGSQTTGMGVEWREKDGSRWIASVPVTPEWRRVVLTEEDFKFWFDSSSVGRGGVNDRLHLENAADFSIMLAKSHGTIPDGEHVFAIAEIGTAPPPYDSAELARLAAPVECYRPDYKMHVLRAVNALRDWQAEAAGGWEDWNNPPSEAYCSISRPRGQGLAGEESARWEPILECRGEENGIGCFAWRLIHHTGKYRGGIWANIGVPADFDLNAIERVARIVERVTARTLDSAVLTKAGSREAAVFRGETVRFGAEVSALNERAPAKVALTFKIHNPEGSVITEKDAILSLSSGGMNSVEFTWESGTAPAGIYTIDTVLGHEAGGTLDRMANSFTLLEIPNDPKESFIQTRDGDFWLGDQKWFIHGINFWPRYIAGQDVTRYNLHWMRPGVYDPEYVERDLNILESLGINLVSVQVNEISHGRTAADFLERCRRHGIRANLFIPEMFPVFKNSPAPNKWREIIEAAKRGNNSTVFAWDVGWEPHLGFEDGRRQWDPEWRDWLIEQYGSPEAAETDWGWPLPRRGDLPTGPLDEQITTDGDWRPFVAAYRRFADDLISRLYGKRFNEVRALAPHALFGMRTGWGGTGTEWAQRGFQFDLASGAIHLDFISPEGWGYPPEVMWEGGIMAAYGRLVSGGKPIFWSEFGQDISLYPDAAKVELQRATYDELFKMVLASRSNGSAGWWYPGGYRLGENSDYGIVDPSGALRPSAKVLQANASQIKAMTEPYQPDAWIAIDRDADARGMYGIRLAARDQFNSLLKAGKLPGLKTAGTDLDSASCPLTAVGNRPYNGHNPPQYLNSEFLHVAVKEPSGRWRGLQSDDRVKASSAGLLVLQARIGNTGEAKWLSPDSAAGRPGAVFLVCDMGDGISMRWPASQDVPFLGTIMLPELSIPLPAARPVTLRLRLEAEGRAVFGQAMRVTVE